MHESTAHQMILEEVEAKGALRHGRRILLHLGNERFGPPGKSIRAVIESLTDLEKVDRIISRILHAGSWKELLEPPRCRFPSGYGIHESTTYQMILEEGELRGARGFLRSYALTKFGPPDDACSAALEAVGDVVRIERMVDRVGQVRSWKELLETP